MRDVAVILVAAGRGRRVGGSIPKQFRPIAGVPMLLRTLQVFAHHPHVAVIMVALPPEFEREPPEFLTSMTDPRIRLVAGGPTRAGTVACAVAAIHDPVDVVLIHDAVRPFVSRKTIDAVIARARTGLGAVPSVPLTDTIRRWHHGSSRPELVPREDLWRAQTPQGFPWKRFKELHAPGLGWDADAPDDAAQWEQAGEALAVVPDRSTNLKITTADDFALAEAMVRALS